MSISDGIGTRVYIGAALNEANRTPSAYVSLTWTEIGSVETVSEFGDDGAVISHTPLATGRTRQRKGAVNPGNITFGCADDPLDAGQIAAIAAAATTRLYPIKVVAADGADSNDTDSVVYFGARILSAKVNRGSTSAVNMRNIVCAIDTTIYEIASVAVSGGS